MYQKSYKSIALMFVFFCFTCGVSSGSMSQTDVSMNRSEIENRMSLFFYFDKSSKAFFVSLLNLTERAYLVDARMALGWLDCLDAEIGFDIVDQEGRRYKNRAKYNIHEATEYDLVELRPARMVGVYIPIEKIIDNYSIEVGKVYKIRAQYKNQYRGPVKKNKKLFKKTVYSNWITVRVPKL